MARGGNGYAINPIGYDDIVFWSIAMRQPTHPWEIALIVKIDNSFRNILGRKNG